jgi:molybdenum cofactor biosynthesis enzyme MoaA
MPHLVSARSLPVLTFEAPLPDAPLNALAGLDQLWFQVAGTVCNLRCGHCFISCAPDNHTFWFLSLDQVQAHLEEAVAAGVREYYLTGGEPFMNRELVPIVQAILEHGPVTALTNATLMKPVQIAALAASERASTYSLEFRVSIDAADAERNDKLRGEGTFARALDGVRLLLDHGFLPIITAAQVWTDAEDAGMRDRFMDLLRSIGYERPRLKILPRLRIGRETERTPGYSEEERVTAEMLAGYDTAQLLCSSARVVTSHGIWVCPILLDSPDARLGRTLTEAARPYALAHRACYTCWQYGALCSNVSPVGG